MARKSQKQTLEDWGRLLEAVEEHASELPAGEAHAGELRRIYTRARIAKELRDALAQATAQATHKLKVALAEGDGPAICLRAVIREELRLRRKPPVDG
jgi:hypothetical protein